MVADREEMDALVQALPSKSAKIRVLAQAGYQRADIARFLDIRYQHVRKVLVDEEARQAKLGDPPREATAVSRDDPRPVKVRLGPDGRVVVPALFREALGLKEGDALIASVGEGELHLMTMPAAVRRAQAMVREFVPKGISLVDELLEDRRRSD